MEKTREELNTNEMKYCIDKVFDSLSDDDFNELIYWVENYGFHFPLRVIEKYKMNFCNQCGLGMWNCNCDWNY